MFGSKIKASLKSFIEANNQKVTTHISPSLRDIRERFYMSNRYLSHKEIRQTIKQIEKLNIPLTIFECLTLVYIINASKINADYNIQETGALWRLDSNNINDFPKLQICTNINKQHLNFLKKKTLDEVIKEDVGFLNNFTHIYIGKQSPYVLRKVRKYLKKNFSKIVFPNTWSLIKKGNLYYYKDTKTNIRLNTKNVYSKGMFENVCLAIKVALDLGIDKKAIQKTLPKLSFEGRFHFLKRGKVKNKLHKNELIMIDGAHATADAKNLANFLKDIKMPKYGIWAMSKNKEPDLFIKQLKGVFKKVITMPIETEANSVSAKQLQKIGYQTAMVGKIHLRGLPQGFDYSAVLPGQGHYYNPDFIIDGVKEQINGYVTSITTNLALDWLKNKRKKDKPFLLLYHQKAPHRNWKPEKKYFSLLNGLLKLLHLLWSLDYLSLPET